LFYPHLIFYILDICITEACLPLQQDQLRTCAKSITHTHTHTHTNIVLFGAYIY